MSESKSQEHRNRELGGYKAALHNPNVSAEAKEHATAILLEHGIPVDESHPSHIPAHDQAHHHAVENRQGHSFKHHSEHHTRHGEDEDKDQSHVIAGYKGTLSKSNTSEEAKQHAREQLKALGVDV